MRPVKDPAGSCASLARFGAGFTLTAVLFSALFPQSSIGAEASVQVRLAGGVEQKFLNVELVLENLVKTLEDPGSWGDFWEQKVPASGNVTNYRFKDIAADLKRYLSDNSLEIKFKNVTGAGRLVANAQTLDRNHVLLYPLAGTLQGAKYSDCALAKTIIHELMHVWQYDKWNAIGRWTDVETIANLVEAKLPCDHFSKEVRLQPSEVVFD
ncbi:MAG: hypothetical protein LC130_01375 [Bryobacterales bacterium]|nr:hypothetical protein [Bryobacterales bacterium]